LSSVIGSGCAPVIYAADIGSVAAGNFGWARLDPEQNSTQVERNDGTEIAELVDAVADDLDLGARGVALGFECPLFVPVPEDPRRLGSALRASRGLMGCRRRPGRLPRDPGQSRCFRRGRGGTPRPLWRWVCRSADPQMLFAPAVAGDRTDAGDRHLLADVVPPVSPIGPEWASLY
jgi:hypothetical protein